MDIKGFKISVDAGHQLENVDSGAVGIGDEDTMNREVTNLVIQKLIELGASVLDVTPKAAVSLTDSLAQRCNDSNVFGAKIHISIHHNAFDGNAHGAETLYGNNEEAKLASAIQNMFVPLGYTDRGIKREKKLYVLKYTVAISVITECGFVDSNTDMALYNADNESKAIVNGIVDYITLLR